jgi:plasmid stabilization system protein ParE
MQFEYREEAIRDLEWFRTYYTAVFPSGAKSARRHHQSIRTTLLLHPQIGHLIKEGAPIRELAIPRTPFSFIYCVSGEKIIVLRLLDSRSERPVSFSV